MLCSAVKIRALHLLCLSLLMQNNPPPFLFHGLNFVKSLGKLSQRVLSRFVLLSFPPDDT